MRKLQKIFNGTSALIIITAMIFALSFITGRINDFKESRNAVKTNISYISPVPGNAERYEETISEKLYIPTSSDKISDTSKTENNNIQEEKTEVFDSGLFAQNIIREYSGDKLIFCEKTGDYRTHNGIDIKTKDSIPAVFDGYIELEENLSKQTACVYLKNDNGETAIYEDVILDKKIKDGAEVKLGDTVGSTSQDNDNIFHFGLMKDNRFINPTEFFN